MTLRQDGAIEKPCRCWLFDQRIATYCFSGVAGKANPWVDTLAFTFERPQLHVLILVGQRVVEAKHDWCTWWSGTY